MKPLLREQFASTFCSLKHLESLKLNFKLDKDFKMKPNTKNLYFSKDLTICTTTLTKKELRKLELEQIKRIDGFWYFKKDLK